MIGHIEPVAVIWKIFSVLAVILAAIVIGTALIMLTTRSIGLPEILLACICAVIGAAGIAGYRAAGALAERQPWARTTIIVLSVVNLFSFPIGTAIGVYSLVVLFNADVVAAFNGGRRASVVS